MKGIWEWKRLSLILILKIEEEEQKVEKKREEEKLLKKAGLHKKIMESFERSWTMHKKIIE